jgi:DNA-binding response OmpR family regulator
MANGITVLDLLLVDDDELLIADAHSVGHPAVRITVARDVASARRLASGRRFDAVAVNVGLADGLGMIENLTGKNQEAPVIAIAAARSSGHTLEHTLTIAELRGAVLALPKPIDAVELAAAAAASAARASGSRPGMVALKRELELLLGGDAIQAA